MTKAVSKGNKSQIKEIPNSHKWDNMRSIIIINNNFSPSKQINILNFMSS